MPLSNKSTSSNVSSNNLQKGDNNTIRKKFKKCHRNDTYNHESTLTRLYAQMHLFASQNPQNTIEFNFCYDNENILHTLATFYKSYPKLIPHNVTLALYKEDKEDKKNTIINIKGTGQIDYDFNKEPSNLDISLDNLKNKAGTLSPVVKWSSAGFAVGGTAAIIASVTLATVGVLNPLIGLGIALAGLAMVSSALITVAAIESNQRLKFNKHYCLFNNVLENKKPRMEPEENKFVETHTIKIQPS
jgi:hypothetical protein